MYTGSDNRAMVHSDSLVMITMFSQETSLLPLLLLRKFSLIDLLDWHIVMFVKMCALYMSVLNFKGSCIIVVKQLQSLLVVSLA